MDALEVLREQHRRVLELFDRFGELREGTRGQRREAMIRLVDAVQVHGIMERDVFYPQVSRTRADLGDLVHANLEMHRKILELSREVLGLRHDDPRFTECFQDLEDQVRHLLAAEERELFPRVRPLFDLNALLEMGADLEARRTELERTETESRPAQPG